MLSKNQNEIEGYKTISKILSTENVLQAIQFAGEQL